MKPSTDLEVIARYGIKAPSGHNTQPWKFSFGENKIYVHPDFSRALPVVDSDNHALYISLGCAVENMVIAASRYGYRAGVSLEEPEGGKPFIEISLSADEAIPKDELVAYIDKRQSTRNEYEDKAVPDSDLESLKNSFDFEGINVLLLTGGEGRDRLEPLIIEGSNRQFQNKKFVEELVKWIRFSNKNARAKADGLWAKCLGLPNIPRFMGKFVMKYLMSAKSEAKRWKKLIDATAGFALFTADRNDAAHWIRLGRAFQRFALTATKLTISHAHVNMPCEEVEVRQKLAEEFRLGSKHPLLLIRFGYSEKMPYSLRRDFDEVVKAG